MTNTFHDFALANGADVDTLNAAAMLVLADRLAGRPARTPGEYYSAAREVTRRYGYGLAAATLIVADWLPEPKPGE